MKILVNKSFVVLEGKELVPYYMNQNYELDNKTAKNFIEKGYATEVAPKQKSVEKNVDVVEEKVEPKKPTTRKKNTKEK